MGYAFVNFIYVEDLLLFAKSQLGVKWWAAPSFVEFSIALTGFFSSSVQEYVFQRKGVADELCELSVRRIIALIYSAVKSNLFFSPQRERSARREVQEFLHYGRTRVLAPKNILLGAWTQAGPAGAFSGCHS